METSYITPIEKRGDYWFKRNYIGSEISQDYVDMANSRILNETKQLSLF